MGQEHYQAGVNMALKAFGIGDQMQQRKLQQELQGQQMQQQAMQMQLIQAQLEEHKRKIENETQKKAWMDKPVSDIFTQEMKTVDAPEYQGQGIPYAPGATIQQPTGRYNVNPNVPTGVALALSPLEKMLEGNKWSPTNREEALEFEMAKNNPPQGSADIQAYNLAKSQGYAGTIMDFFKSKQTSQKPISMGNAPELAMNEKFGMGWMNDPTTTQQAHSWLGTPEGKQRVQEWATRVTPPTYSFPVTSEGIVPAQSRGPGAGKIGEPTGYKKPLSDAQLSKVGEINTVLKNIEKTKELYGYGTGKEHEEWVGPLAGRKGGLEAKFTGTALPEQVKFYAYVKDMQDALLRARSGAQINEQEYKRLVAFLPEPNLPPVTFKAKLERFQEATQTLLDEKIAAFEKGGYGMGDAKQNQVSGTTRFTIGGKTYNIPNELVPQFKKDKGLK